MVLTTPVLLILLALGVVQLAAGVVLGRMLPPARRQAVLHEERQSDLAGSPSADEVAVLIEQRLTRLVQLTAELHGRLQIVEGRLDMPVAPGLPQDAPDDSSDPSRLAHALQSRLAELVRG